jgi:hypothetical protein
MALPGSNEEFPDAAFVDEVVTGLRKAPRFIEAQQAALERAKHFSWQRVVDEWDESFSRTLVTT